MSIKFGIRDLRNKDGICYPLKDIAHISFPKDAHEHLSHFEDQSFWFAHRNKIIRGVITKYKSSGLFFDIGGGNGYVAKMLCHQKNIVPVMIEPFLSGCLKAKSRGVKNIVCSDFASLKFAEKMKLVGLFDVIEHIEDDDNFIKKISESMQKNGLIFATVPAFQFLWSKIDEESGHYRRYTLRNFVYLFEQNDFEILHKKYFFTYLVPLMLLIRRQTKKHAESEHKISGFKLKIIKFLNVVDKLLMTIFKGYFPGGSIIIVAKRK